MESQNNCTVTNYHTHYVKPSCEHSLKLCPICDTVWCEKCGKEWKVYTYTWYYSTPTYVYNTTPIYSEGDKMEECGHVLGYSHTHGG